MKIFQQHIRHAAAIIQAYDGKLPLAIWLKQFFKEEKKYGSKDRRQIAQLCYCYFRAGNLLKAGTLEEKILAALFLSSKTSNELLQAMQPKWNEMVQAATTTKISLLGIEAEVPDLFPFREHISAQIDGTDFALSHLEQPKVFLRIRPGCKQQQVLQKLEAAQVPYTLPAPLCVAVAAASKLDNILDINKEVVVQDLSSQQLGTMMQLISWNKQQPIKIWDCCAASGGKSLLAKDIFGNVQLQLSDIRESILINLKKRLQLAGINPFRIFRADLSQPIRGIPAAPVDLVLADTPCSGSGTWGRTPEQCHFFKAAQIKDYSSLQRQIVKNAIPFLAKDGYLLYSTCSVFKEENEDQVKWMEEECNLVLQHQQLFKGYQQQADTLFAALFTRA